MCIHLEYVYVYMREREEITNRSREEMDRLLEDTLLPFSTHNLCWRTCPLALGKMKSFSPNKTPLITHHCHPSDENGGNPEKQAQLLKLTVQTLLCLDTIYLPPCPLRQSFPVRTTCPINPDFFLIYFCTALSGKLATVLFNPLSLFLLSFLKINFLKI